MALYHVYRLVLVCLYLLIFAGSFLHDHELGSTYENQLLIFLIIPVIIIEMLWLWLPVKMVCTLNAVHGMLLFLAIATTYAYMGLTHNDINSLSIVAAIPILPLVIESIAMVIYLRRMGMIALGS